MLRAVHPHAGLAVAALLTLPAALLPLPLGAQEPVAAADTASAADDLPRRITIDDQFALARVGAPVVSPDGGWVAYTVRTEDPEAETSETRLWMTAADGSGEPLPMTRAGESVGSPAWSPDGRWLSFTASFGEDAETQVWALDRRGGEARALTEVEEGVRGYAWSPDGTRLVLEIRDPEPEDSAWTAEPPEPWVVDRLQFKRDGVGYLTDWRPTHLWVMEVESRELRRLTTGPHDARDPAWSPDGTRIAFVSNRTDDPDTNANTDLWVVDADAPEPVAEPRRLTTNPGSDGSPAWSPDGRLVAYTTVTRPDLIWYATTHLAMVGADGSDPRVLTAELDRNVSSPRFSPGGEVIYFGLEDSGENQVAAWDLAAGTVRRVTEGPHSVRGMDVGPTGLMAVRVARTDLPGDVFRAEGAEAAAEGGESADLHRLTAVNDSLLAVLELGEVREERWESETGVEIEGFVHLPPDHEPGRRHPLLLRPHGGPVSQYSHSFNFEAHLFAANGYVVLTPNPRGSSGYGQDFSAVLWADWGTPDFVDVMAGVDHLIDQGVADPDRMGVGGWSYGGILTNYVITQTDRFEGAITGASEVLYIANYGHDHYQRQWEAELGLPWEDDNREAWERISPFNRVHEITTPTLIMGGEDDWNVPIQNSEQLYQALRRRGVPTQLVVYPGQSHGIGPASYRRDRHRRYLEWYERWVKGAEVGDRSAAAPPASPLPATDTARLLAPGVVSSRAPEFAAAFTPDGRTLYFNRATDDRSAYQVMESRFTDGTGGGWSEPEVASFSGTGSDIDPFVTPGGVLLFNSTRPLPQSDTTARFATYRVDPLPDGGWTDPVPLEAPFNSPGHDVFASVDAGGVLYVSSDREGMRRIYRIPGFDGASPGAGAAEALPLEEGVSNPLITPDGRTLILVSGRDGGRGQGDLWATCLEGDEPGPLVNLGSAVNTPFTEFAPALTPDGEILVFTSERPGVVASVPDGERPPGDLYYVSLSAVEMPCEGGAAEGPIGE